MSNWPDPARPGVPLNPEQSGWWHVNGAPKFWLADCRAWRDTDGEQVYYTPAHDAARWGWNLTGPCLTPAEVAAREAAAFKRGAEAMREQAALVAAMEAVAASCQAEEAPPDSPSMCWQQGRSDGSARVRDAIRALPVPEDRT